MARKPHRHIGLEWSSQDETRTPRNTRKKNKREKNTHTAHERQRVRAVNWNASYIF